MALSPIRERLSRKGAGPLKWQSPQKAARLKLGHISIVCCDFCFNYLECRDRGALACTRSSLVKKKILFGSGERAQCLRSHTTTLIQVGFAHSLPHWLAHNTSNCSYEGSTALFWTLQAPACTHLHAHACTCTLGFCFLKKSLKIQIVLSQVKASLLPKSFSSCLFLIYF